MTHRESPSDLPRPNQSAKSGSLPDFLTIRRLAKLLDYSTRSIWRWGKRENLRFVKVGNRAGMWRRDYERWLNWKRGSR